MSRLLCAPERDVQMRAVFDANAKPLLKFLMRLTNGHREAAEDLLQETMLRAWRNVEELPDNETSIRRWLFIVAKHAAIDAVRARRVRPAEVAGDTVERAASIEDVFDGLLDRHELREALLRLSSAHRTVIVELYYGGSSITEVAERLGVPAGTVRSRTFYALQAMRAALNAAAQPDPALS
jgi:RNA polymerase sigma-70 factor (ECF subfamily)